MTILKFASRSKRAYGWHTQQAYASAPFRGANCVALAALLLEHLVSRDRLRGGAAAGEGFLEHSGPTVPGQDGSDDGRPAEIRHPSPVMLQG